MDRFKKKWRILNVNSKWKALFCYGLWLFACEFHIGYFATSFGYNAVRRNESLIRGERPTRCYTIVYWTYDSLSMFLGNIMPIIRSPKHVERIISSINYCIASSWSLSSYHRRCTDKHTSRISHCFKHYITREHNIITFIISLLLNTFF